MRDLRVQEAKEPSRNHIASKWNLTRIHPATPQGLCCFHSYFKRNKFHFNLKVSAYEELWTLSRPSENVFHVGRQFSKDSADTSRAQTTCQTLYWVLGFTSEK